MFVKKRRAEGSPEVSADDGDEFEQLPFIGRHCVDRALKKADEALAAIEQSAKQMRKKLRQQAKTIRKLITTNGGQPAVTAPLSEEIEINVGGTVLCVPRMCASQAAAAARRERLVHRLSAAAPSGWVAKDTEGRPFLDADPVYVDW